MPIPITKPVFGDGERRAVQLPLETGWVVQGPYVERFERAFAAFCGVSHAAATSSCTSALHVAAATLGIEPGDEVIVPAFTWISTANVVEYLGGKPVFCDIDLETFNLDVRMLPSLVTNRTVGILPVHLFGLCAEMKPILELAGRRGLWVLEDAACAFGARHEGRHAGTFGEAGAFSFHPRKSITTGEGGMVTTADAKVDAHVRSLRDHGASRSDFDRHETSGAFLLADYPMLGFNYRMTDIQGALGVAQLERADWILAARRKTAHFYDEALDGIPWLRTPATPDGYEHGYQSYVCLYAPDEPSLANAADLHRERNKLMASLEEKGIATRQGTHAVVLQRFYAERYGLRPEEFPNATVADRLSLALPLFPQLTEAEQTAVVDALREYG